MKINIIVKVVTFQNSIVILQHIIKILKSVELEQSIIYKVQHIII